MVLGNLVWHLYNNNENALNPICVGFGNNMVEYMVTITWTGVQGCMLENVPWSRVCPYLRVEATETSVTS